tara:strand:+ start:339 stop:557 length:219 start_codon:yes stop_codon:yes gene_type:complete
LYQLAYAGPVLASIAFNGVAAVFAAICVYIYLNRIKLKKNRFLNYITKPLHRPISQIAIRNLRKKEREKGSK